MKEISPKELEKIEEKKLIDSIIFLNNSYKNKNKIEFIEALTDLCPNNLVIKSLSDISSDSTIWKNKSEQFAGVNTRIKTKRTFSDLFDSHVSIGLIEKNTLNDVLEKGNLDIMFNNDHHKTSQKIINNVNNPSANNKLKISNSPQTHLSAMSTLNTDTNSFKTFTTINVENILSQNLNLAEDIIKLITIGDKRVGKSYFIEKILSNDMNHSKSTEENVSKIGKENSHQISSYEPTTSLEIKRTLINLKDKIVKLELWDTNVNIINNSIIKTYYKLCHGVVLVCDVGSIDSIRFIERQLENILAYTNNLNFFIIANIRDDIDVNDIHSNLNHLNHLADKFMIKPSFVNFSEYCFTKDLAIKKFIEKSLMKKVNSKIIGKKKIPSATERLTTETKEFLKERICDDDSQDFQRKNNHTPEKKIFNQKDLGSSPQSAKKENCTVF